MVYFIKVKVKLLNYIKYSYSHGQVDIMDRARVEEYIKYVGGKIHIFLF